MTTRSGAEGAGVRVRASEQEKEMQGEVELDEAV